MGRQDFYMRPPLRCRKINLHVGGSMIDHNIYRSDYWNSHEEYNPYTYNYYLNITIFPWLEVAYTCDNW